MKESKLINKLIRYILRKFGYFQFEIVYLSDNPKHEDLELNTIYIVGGKNYVKWAYMKCPDNCGETIILNLSQSRKPNWRVRQDKIGRISIYPSIHKTDGCESHFWITKGRLFTASEHFQY